jgi:predicted nucleic acid-binding protein
VARLIYILDTNVLADRINRMPMIEQRLNAAIAADHRLLLSSPVHYEVYRGLLRTNATRKQQFFEEKLVPALEWVNLLDEDWRQAARLWAWATTHGKQLSDVDLLIAALAVRLDGIIVSSDTDFDVLSLPRENWREHAL